MFDQEILQAAILGIIQGASEFLPISSSGHLIVIPNIFGWDGLVNSLTFDIALHLGTTVAVVSFFWKDWFRLFLSFIKILPKGLKGMGQDPNSKMLILLGIGSVPAAFAGFFLEKTIETLLRDNFLVAANLIIFALLLYVSDKQSKKNRSEKNISFFDSLFIGLAQAIALFPGVSRSGVTISAGLLRNLDRESATRFSFLLSTPAILGASLLKIKDITATFGENGSIYFIGFVAAAVSGWLSIKVLLNFVKSNNFNVFVVYRILLGLAIIFLLF